MCRWTASGFTEYPAAKSSRVGSYGIRWACCSNSAWQHRWGGPEVVERPEPAPGVRESQWRDSIEIMKNQLTVALLLFACALDGEDHKITAVRFAKLWDGEKVVVGPLVWTVRGPTGTVLGGSPQPPAEDAPDATAIDHDQRSI